MEALKPHGFKEHSDGSYIPPGAPKINVALCDNLFLVYSGGGFERARVAPPTVGLCVAPRYPSPPCRRGRSERWANPSGGTKL